MNKVEPKPAVKMPPVLAPVRSNRVLVATVVPWENRRTREMNSGGVSPRSSAARSNVSSTPRTRSSGVVGDL
jgi:hypothetical protein